VGVAALLLSFEIAAALLSFGAEAPVSLRAAVGLMDVLMGSFEVFPAASGQAGDDGELGRAGRTAVDPLIEFVDKLLMGEGRGGSPDAGIPSPVDDPV